MGMNLLLTFLLKGFLLLSCYSVLRHFFSSRIETAVVSYLLQMVIQNASYLLLSVNCNLNAVGIVVCYLVSAICLNVTARKLKKQVAFEPISVPSLVDIIVAAFWGILLAGLVLRPFFYYDTTDDALVQGMTKLAFIEQHQSLFVHYDSLTINTFSNEWLGEMNGLYYMLLMGQDYAASFGNVEIIMFMAVAFYYITKAYGYKGKYASVIMFVAVTLPVVIGLSMTIKTDLISIALMPLSVAFLLQYYKKEKPQLLFASILSLGATAASKISALPGAGLLLIALVVFYFFKAKHKPVMPVVCGAVGSFILCDRYIINLVQYGNPFQRALNEKMSFSLENLKISILGCISEFFEITELASTLQPWSSSNWLVTKGLGYFGCIFIVVFAICIVIWLIEHSKSKQIKIELQYIVLPVVCGFLFFCANSVWMVWSFRYVAPYLMVAYFFCFTVLQRYEAKMGYKTFMAITLVVGMLNGLSAFRTGQAFPYAAERADEMSRTEKKLAYASSPTYKDLSEIDVLVTKLETGGKCLIFDTFSYPFYHFFGDNHCVKLDLAYDEKELVEQAFAKEYDFYVIATSKEDAGNYTMAKDFFSLYGYEFYETTSGLVIIDDE